MYSTLFGGQGQVVDARGQERSWTAVICRGVVEETVTTRSLFLKITLTPVIRCVIMAPVDYTVS